VEFRRGHGDHDLIPAYVPADFMEETRLRVHAYRELAECLTEKELDALEKAWRDRFGRFPASVGHLHQLHRAKIRGAAKKITLIEVKGQKLTLTRNGLPITIDNRHPRLKSIKAAEKLDEVLELLCQL
jgi:transcription-repair coupling factor (superfamily II helicase)